MLRFLLLLAIIAGLGVCGATVKLGNRTFFGHIRAIWHTEEAQDMKRGIEEKAGPVVDKIKRGAKAGWDEATRDDAGARGSGGAGSSAGSGSALEAPLPAPPTR